VLAEGEPACGGGGAGILSGVHRSSVAPRADACLGS
jgi:hypothetical protein